MEARNRGNMIGMIAILLWATLATFTVLAGTIPAFQLLAMSFSVAFLIGIIWWSKAGWHSLRMLKQPLKVWIVGVGGLFGYHFFYFMAIKNAPAVEANLINYLWPLLIVLFSAFLPGEKLRWYHGLGAFFGFIGAALLVLGKGEGLQLGGEYSMGYIYAVLCALTWSGYSVISRLFGSVPTHVVGGFCGVTMVLAWGCHFIFEVTVVPSFVELFAAIMLGLGPVGGAFFVWDIGMKQGDIKLLGSLAYGAPLLSTLLLIVLGLAASSWSVWMACGLIIIGSLISSGEYIKLLREKVRARRT